MQPRQTQVYQLRGINLSDDYAEGSMADCENISSERFPYFTTRKERVRVGTWDEVTAMTSWNKLVLVKGTKLYYDGNEVGTVTAGEKQFAIVNTKLVIMPDKKYLDMQTLQLVDMEATYTATKNIATTAPDDDAKQTMTIYSATDSNNWGFKVGDVVEVIINLGTFSLHIEDITTSSGNTVFTFGTASDNFTATSSHSSSVSIKRKVPTFDYICEGDNRVWGVVNSEQTIYASALGDPTNFYNYAYDGDAMSYAIAVGSEGNFTGIKKLGSSICFFKSNMLHKLVGGEPSSYNIYSYSIEGVKEGCFRSMQVINETLLYMGSSGIFSYGGGTTNFLSMPLGNKGYKDAVAGTDGEKYYLSCKDRDNRKSLFVYDIKNNLWLREDDSEVKSFARSVDKLYMLIGGKVFYPGNEPLESSWAIQFNPFYEKTSYRGKTNGILFNKKRYSKVLLRVSLHEGSYCIAKVRCDNGRWREVGTIHGKNEDTVIMQIPLDRCDKFEIRLEGVGAFTLLNLQRTYMSGSERNE